MTLARLFNWFLLELGSESYTILLYPLSRANWRLDHRQLTALGDGKCIL